MLKYTKKEKKRLGLDLELELHSEIKRRSINRNITMKDWVMIAIMERIEKEAKYE